VRCQIEGLVGAAGAVALEAGRGAGDTLAKGEERRVDIGVAIWIPVGMDAVVGEIGCHGGWISLT
jgi:hypothetical protein